jgi:hypothetical protein
MERSTTMSKARFEYLMRKLEESRDQREFVTGPAHNRSTGTAFIVPASSFVARVATTFMPCGEGCYPDQRCTVAFWIRNAGWRGCLEIRVLGVA